jgi:hypothetical protein
MILLAEIKLTSPILGNLRQPMEGGGQIKRLDRDGSGNIVTRREHWQWAVKEAMETLQLPDIIDQVCLPELLPISAPSTGLHNRHYRKTGKLKTESFESVRKGAVLTIGMVYHTPAEKSLHKKKPEMSEIELILSYIGQFVGISQWGSQHGYGRFELLNLRSADMEELKSILTQRIQKDAT